MDVYYQSTCDDDIMYRSLKDSFSKFIYKRCVRVRTANHRIVYGILNVIINV